MLHPFLLEKKMEMNEKLGEPKALIKKGSAIYEAISTTKIDTTPNSRDIANYIRKAISDDDLVDNASKINIDKISKSVNYDILKEKTNNIYLTLQKKLYE